MIVVLVRSARSLGVGAARNSGGPDCQGPDGLQRSCGQKGSRENGQKEQISTSRDA